MRRAFRRPGGWALGLVAALMVAAGPVRAEGPGGAQRLAEAMTLFESGQYYKAARYAFSAQSQDPRTQADAYSLITLGLLRARMPNAASYFFIKTLQSGSKPAIRRVLGHTEALLARVGSDLLRNYLIRHTAYEDYDAVNRSAYLFSLGKDALLLGQPDKAVGYLKAVSPQSAIYPFALQLRGTAHAILGKGDEALADFRACDESAEATVVAPKDDEVLRLRQAGEADDLRARCRAGFARTLYQLERFEEADRAFDRVAKESLVWPDILFEQAWNSFARGEANRALGKLVSYKSPSLQFVHNPEIEVLRAQSYLALCLYSDANEVINEFNTRYVAVGEEVKRLVESNGSNPEAFWSWGKQVVGESLYSGKESYRMANRFLRGPYFMGLVAAEQAVAGEREASRRFGSTVPGAVAGEAGGGFPAFLEQVLAWRLKSIHELGGVFVKNSLLDYHSALIGDFEKMAFIKLEMLRRAKELLLYKKDLGLERSRGNQEPKRRDDQYYWNFNGEFWNDELGDYVFGLESECRS